MTKSELRKARKAAVAAGLPLTGELAIPGQHWAQPAQVPQKRVRRAPRNRYASQAEQHARYIDCGPGAWDDKGDY